MRKAKRETAKDILAKKEKEKTRKSSSGVYK